MKTWVPIVGVLLVSCGRVQDPAVDPSLASEIGRIRAIDNHAHPVLFTPGGTADREFDALPVDNMEPASDPLGLRPDSPVARQAAQALFGTTRKQAVQDGKRESYPTWVLDQIGV